MGVGVRVGGGGAGAVSDQNNTGVWEVMTRHCILSAAAAAAAAALPAFASECKAPMGAFVHAHTLLVPCLSEGNSGFLCRSHHTHVPAHTHENACVCVFVCLLYMLVSAAFFF